ncbi:MAG: aminotransferase class V-fold PLP-dependent enzyme [Candidatus Kaiserbacteria bacterium]|nr:aminotransferase class V-fold PLP-dependent enzyme [Candidatus Kaiserbacteria bacterium]
MFNTRTYLDSAAGVSGNPSSPHREGRRAKQMLEDARTTIAHLIEVRPDDVVFTSGATESNALAILGVAKTGDRMCYLPSAHASVVENMNLVAERGVKIEALPIKDGQVDCEKLRRMLRPETKLVSMDAVCGETGIIWNTREVREVIGSKILLHIDASQAPLTEKITRAHFGADMLTFDASKVGTTRGIGALIAHRTIPITPLYAGGGQERGLRSGSESPELAKAFSENLRVAVCNRERFRASAEHERTRLVEMIMKNISNVYLQEGRVQAPNILNLSFQGRDTDYLVALLDEEGFAVSTRSACETDSEEGSRAVFVLTGDRERARSTLRISWNSNVHPRMISRFAKALVRAVAFIDKEGKR